MHTYAYAKKHVNFFCGFKERQFMFNNNNKLKKKYTSQTHVHNVMCYKTLKQTGTQMIFMSFQKTEMTLFKTQYLKTRETESNQYNPLNNCDKIRTSGLQTYTL